MRTIFVLYALVIVAGLTLYAGVGLAHLKAMRLWLRNNGLSLFFRILLLGALAGRSLAGQRAYNERLARVEAGGRPARPDRQLRMRPPLR